MKKELNKKITTKRFQGFGLLFSNLPFVFFVAVLGVIYIANAHAAEKKARQIQELKKEIKVLKWQYQERKQTVNYHTTQSKLEDKVKKMDLKLADEAPIKLAELKE